MALPDVGPAVTAGVLARAPLEAVRLAGRVGLGPALGFDLFAIVPFPLGSRTGARSRTREPETSLRQRRRIEVLRLPRSRPPTRFSVLGYGRETGRASSKPHVQPCVSVARIARAAQHSTDSGRLKFTAATRTRPLRLELVLDDIGQQITAALAFRLAHVSSHNFSVTHARALRCSRHRRRLVS